MAKKVQHSRGRLLSAHEVPTFGLTGESGLLHVVSGGTVWCLAVFRLSVESAESSDRCAEEGRSIWVVTQCDADF